MDIKTLSAKQQQQKTTTTKTKTQHYKGIYLFAIFGEF